ncbi:MAG: glucose-6-phosphate isomerase [Candidatus Sericytochromatia bacterium]
MEQYLQKDWQDSMRIKLDYNNMLSRVIGDKNGLNLEDILSLSDLINVAHDDFINKKGKGNDFLGFIDLPDTNKNVLDEIQKTADDFASKSDIFLILGIGGSYLGAKTLFDSLNSPYYNELSREKRNNKPRIYFEGNNLDCDSISHLLDLLPNSKPNKIEDTFSINVISKSGATIETAVAFRIFQEKAKEVYGDIHNNYVVAVTDQEKGKLKEICNKEGYKSFVIPDNVGGRYSVLTPVGLLPAAVFGVNIHELVAGAKYMKDLCQSPNILENPAYMYASLQYLSYKRGRNISAMAIWAKALESLGFWYDQLSAESLGKEGKGRVPFTIVDTRDLHSRGQELQEGEENTVVTNIFVNNSKKDFNFKANSENLDGLNYLDGKSIKSMVLGAMEGTNYAYAKANRPTMNLMIPELNAFTLGQIFYLFEVATVIEGYMMDINPLDQPGVEAYKKFMFANLGREDMKKYKEEFDNRTQPENEYIV